MRKIRKKHYKHLKGLRFLAYIVPAIFIIPVIANTVTQHTTVGYEKFLRLNEPQNKTKNSDWLDFSHRYDYRSPKIQGSFLGDARFYLNNNNASVSLRQGHMQYKSDTGSTYSLGRKFLNWNSNEKFWQLDHFQNNRGFRLMDMKQEGLTGFHYKTNDGALTTEIFLSYFYIPSLNPSVKIKNGQVTSNVDWYKKPPEKTIINNQEVDIFYNLNDPKYRDIVIQKSLGARMGIDWGEKPYKGALKGYIIYKPERNLRINAEAFYDPTIDKVVVNANPVVNHHVMYGLEFEQRWENYFTKTGFVTIDPNARLGQDFDSLSIEIENNRKLVTDFFLVEPKYYQESYFHYMTSMKNDLYIASVNFLHYLSDHEKGSDDFYSETVKWKSALGFGLQYQVNFWIQTSFSLRYDLERKDNLFNAQVIINPWKQSSITLGTELIKSPQRDSYWSAYRTNDTFYLNLSYLF